MSQKERWEKAKAHGKPDQPGGVLPDPDEDVADDDGPPPPKDNERWDGDPPKPGHP